MKELNGAELAGYIKERQVGVVRRMMGRAPKLVIIRDNDDPVIAKYVGLKKRYGEDIGVVVEDRLVASGELAEEVERANKDAECRGIIVQLPLLNADITDEVVAKIAPEKDVDGMGGGGLFDSATATAINWLLGGYGVELVGKKIAIVGRGRLVGAPLEKMWRGMGLSVEVFRSGDMERLGASLPDFDVIVTATGMPGLITADMVKSGAVVVDAGTASEGGVIRGDVADEVRERGDVMITPKIGGVGPLTVAVLFENLVRSVRL